MSYKHKCEYCGENVTYASIWEAELHWNHSCKGLEDRENYIDSLSVFSKWRESRNKNSNKKTKSTGLKGLTKASKITVERKMKPYTQAAKAKGYTLKAIAARWGLKDRQMAYIAAKPKQRDWDALSGLPVENLKKCAKARGK